MCTFLISQNLIGYSIFRNHPIKYEKSMRYLLQLRAVYVKTGYLLFNKVRGVYLLIYNCI